MNLDDLNRIDSEIDKEIDKKFRYLRVLIGIVPLFYMAVICLVLGGGAFVIYKLLAFFGVL